MDVVVGEIIEEIEGLSGGCDVVLDIFVVVEFYEFG